MRRVVVVIVGLTGGEQSYNEGMGEAVKREITQGLQERHGLDKGIAIADKCALFDFETCEEINLYGKKVRCNACFDACCVWRCVHLSSTSPHEPHATRCNSWRIAAFSRCAQASADSSA